MNAQTIKDLEEARELLAARYTRGRLIRGTPEGGPPYAVCGMGALSMKTIGRAQNWFPGSTRFDSGMDMIAKAFEELPDDHEIARFLWGGLRNPFKLITNPNSRRDVADNKVMQVNDHLGKEAILKVFDAAICIAKREAGLSPAPPFADAVPTDELQPPSGGSASP